MRVVGFLEDEPGAADRTRCISVVGSPTELDRLAARYKADLVIVAKSGVKGGAIRRLVEAGCRLGLQIRMLRTSAGQGAAHAPRDVNIQGLLVHSEIRLDHAAIVGSLQDVVRAAMMAAAEPKSVLSVFG